MSKPKILIACPLYFPGFKGGGPIRSVSNLVATLSESFDFYIVTSDRDHGDDSPYPGISPHDWMQVGSARVMYVAPGMGKFLTLWRVVRGGDWDCVYLNGFFNFSFSLFPLIVRRISRVNAARFVLAPRGELSPGALALKNKKKIFYIACTHFLGLHKKLIWHATADLESFEISKIADRNGGRVLVAPNIATKFEAPPPPMESSILRVVFLSRISPKKNLAYAIRVVSRMASPVVLDIYGPAEDEDYWSACKDLIAKAPVNVEIRYKGPIAPAEVVGVLAKYDVFFLPTLGENYGHVVVESFLAGTPVLISDKTPWTKLEELGVGYSGDLSNEDMFLGYLNLMSSLDFDSKKVLRDRVLEKGRSISYSPSAVEATKLMFERIDCED
ncbi:glycosyltransferase [Variovorax boronicumulans]|uniref:glycosyltransferase n=1 Tax=Variovorax boronicumulans TaxID=436515 RepID=UPI0009F56047|nr:glycosyltransferase [Variovorax boronicumulans]